jgi:hypothetical protein
VHQHSTQHRTFSGRTGCRCATVCHGVPRCTLIIATVYHGVPTRCAYTLCLRTCTTLYPAYLLCTMALTRAALGSAGRARHPGKRIRTPYIAKYHGTCWPDAAQHPSFASPSGRCGALCVCSGGSSVLTRVSCAAFFGCSISSTLL